MEYIKKEELIIGEVYTHKNGNICRCDQITNMYIIGKYLGNGRNEFRQPPKNPGNFLINQMRLATSEEKHWLLECIRLDKFIEFEEAMKTFIPEYYQYIGEINSYKSSFIKGKTYKIINKNDLEASFNFIDEKGTPNGYEGVNWKKFKPSTKEAYDAQFVVKEPLPQFKVIETIETITKVENNEGSQFFIGDNIIKSTGKIPHKIKSFKYNNDKTNILVLTNYNDSGISIDKIEHYIKPKNEK